MVLFLLIVGFLLFVLGSACTYYFGFERIGDYITTASAVCLILAVLILGIGNFVTVPKDYTRPSDELEIIAPLFR